MREAMARQEARTDGIENYTVYQTAFGMESSIRFERRDVDGISMLVPVQGTSSMGDIPIEQAEEQAAYSDPWRSYEAWVSGAELAGTEAVDGRECWVIQLNEFPEQAFAVPGRDDGTGFEPESGRMFVDRDEYLVRRFEVHGTVHSEGNEREGSAVISLSDYRGERGLMHPHLMTVSLDGLMDEGQSEEARSALDEMEKRLENMSEQERAMVERMMSGQMEQLRRMLGGEGMEIRIETTRLEVNTPPGG